MGTRGLFPWAYSGRGLKLTTHLHLLPRSRMREAIPPLPNTPSWRGVQLKNVSDVLHQNLFFDRLISLQSMDRCSRTKTMRLLATTFFMLPVYVAPFYGCIFLRIMTMINQVMKTIRKQHTCSFYHKVWKLRLKSHPVFLSINRPIGIRQW
jgi:hypothetical protein